MVHVHVQDHAKHTNQPASWFYSTAFAAIAFVALLRDLDRLNDESDELKDQSKKVKWAASGILIALGFAGIGSLMGMFLRRRFLGTMLEVVLAALTVGIWAAVMPAIMNPENRIATEGDFGRIISANLFVFPWLGLLAALNALNAAMRTAFHRKTDDDVSHRDEKSGKWFLTWGAFVATSLIVMMAASRQYEDMQCDDEDNTMCDRLQYATWLGAIGGFLAFIWMLVDLCVKMQTALIEGILAVLLLVAWCFGVAYITFSDDAPAPTFSTLYFFSWASLLLACNLAASTLYQLMGRFIPGDEDSVEVEVEEVRVKEVEHSEEEEEDVRGPIAPEDQGTFVPGDQGTYARTDEEIGTTPTTPEYK